MPRYKDPPSLETLTCENLLSVLYHLTVNHDIHVSNSAARRQHLQAKVPPNIKQKLVTMITSSLNQDLNITCKLLDYTVDSSTTALDLSSRKHTSFTFPVEQVQTVYRLLMRAEPASLERLCMGIHSSELVDVSKDEYCWYTGGLKKKDESSKVLVYNSYFYPTLEKMKKLRHVVLNGVCDNQVLAIMGQYCSVINYLDITGSIDVTDVGMQNLVFPPSVQKAGRVNLVNTRAKTNPAAKQLHTILAHDTGVDVTGCIILLQFCPRLTKGGGRLDHESVGDAVYTLNKKLKVANLTLKGMIDPEINKEKEWLFSGIISRLEVIKTSGKCLENITGLCTPQNAISELYLDFDGKDYRPDLINYINYNGHQIKILVVRGMDEPLQIDIVSKECPNIEELHLMLNGSWTPHGSSASHGHHVETVFPKLQKLNIKTNDPDTLLSFMRHNLSVKELHISYPDDVKSKFTDVFIQTACKISGLLPNLQKLVFCSKFPYGFSSAQKLIKSLVSLDYIGPMDMFTKLSKVDVNDLVGWVKEMNWNVVIGYKTTNLNVFNIDESDPWKYKYIPDVGRVPVKKEIKTLKRTLSIQTIYSDEEEETSRSRSSDGRKRSKINSQSQSLFAWPSEASVKRSGSIVSIKKSPLSSTKNSIIIDENCAEFEFEFACDSDGVFRNNNKDFYLPEPEQTRIEDEYDDYDEYDEDTMDVEEIPEDAEFEWCWGDDGQLKIYEIGADEVAGRRPLDDIFEHDELITNGVGLNEFEQKSLEKVETELSFSSGKVTNNLKNGDNNFFFQNGYPDEACNNVVANENDHIQEDVITYKSDDYNSSRQKSSNSLGKSNKEKTVSFKEESLNKKLDSLSSKINNSKELKVNQKDPNKPLGKIASFIQKLSHDDEKNSQKEEKKMQEKKVHHEEDKKSSDKKYQDSYNSSKTQDKKYQDSYNSSKTQEKKAQDPFNSSKMAHNEEHKEPRTQIVEVFEYDPMLGYCTVKRKKIPIVEVTDHDKPNNIIKMDTNQKKPEVNEEQWNNRKNEENIVENIPKEKEVSLTEQSSPAVSSGTSSKENKSPNKRERKQEEVAPLEPLLPQSTMSKYDIPFLGKILAANTPRPEPPKSKPPTLPKSHMPFLHKDEVKEEAEKKNETAREVNVKDKMEGGENKLSIDKEEPVKKDNTFKQDEESKQEETKDNPDEKPNENVEWYWDYDDNCWKECDPDEEYEWEYLDSEEENELEAKSKASIKEELAKDVQSVLQSVISKHKESLETNGAAVKPLASLNDNKEKDGLKKNELQKDARTDGKTRYMNTYEEEEGEMSPLPPSFSDRDLEKDRKQATKWGKSKMSRQNSRTKLSREDSLDDISSESPESNVLSTRQRRKGVLDDGDREKAASLQSLKDKDDQSQSLATDISQRRKERKSSRKERMYDDGSNERLLDVNQNKVDEYSPTKNKSRPFETTLKRRNTGKKSDRDGNKASFSRHDKVVDLINKDVVKEKQDKKYEREKKKSDNKYDKYELYDKSRTRGSIEKNIDQIPFVSRKEDKSDKLNQFAETSSEKETESDVDTDSQSSTDRNVVFCMWGHENCPTRSHYRYNWQWDYVQKYAEQINKNLLQGVVPREEEAKKVAPSYEDGYKLNPTKDGIKLRLQLLQDRVIRNTVSDNVKQKTFERDLELEMLRRRHTYLPQEGGKHSYLP